MVCDRTWCVIAAAGMSSDEVHAVLDALDSSGCPVWIGGGWGVDAHVGHQTRPHRDLDLAITVEREAATLDALEELGYAPTSSCCTSWPQSPRTAT